MLRQLFKPGKGQKPARFIAAYVNGSAVYRGDLVCWDALTAPTDQGSSGVLAGETLGTADHIYVILPPATDAGAQGLQAGIVEGNRIGDRRPSATANVMLEDNIAIIQTWGVHSNTWVDDTDVVAGVLLGTGATTGECTHLLATDRVHASSIIGEGSFVAFALTDDWETHYRAGSTTEEACVAFVRCDG
jgi:hypothetical protein